MIISKACDNKLVIGIDGNEANVDKRVGVNEYAFQLLWNLKKLQETGENPHNLIVYLKEAPLPDLPKETQMFKYKIIRGGGMWILTKLMPYLLFNPDKLNVLFSPSHYTVPFSHIPRVSSIMDLGYLDFSAQFTKKVFWQLKWWSAMSIFVSKYIISISESTKKDIVRHYPFSRQKVKVTYLGYDAKRFNYNISSRDVRRVKNKYSIVGDYILYLGTLKPSKNVEGLIDAYAMINAKKINAKLVIAGKRGWLYENIYKKVLEMGLKDKVVFTDYLPDEDRAPLMKGAKVYVQPSFWEGFGIEVVNAMACGVPVVVSKVGSLPEVVGKAGLLVNPNDINDIANGLLKILLSDKIGYNKLVEAGLIQTKKFSWVKTARETLKILEYAGQRRK